jgi:hypothetical protein
MMLSVSTSYHIANVLMLNTFTGESFIFIILSSCLLFQMYLHTCQVDIILEPPARLQQGFTILYNFIL